MGKLFKYICLLVLLGTGLDLTYKRSWYLFANKPTYITKVITVHNPEAVDHWGYAVYDDQQYWVEVPVYARLREGEKYLCRVKVSPKDMQYKYRIISAQKVR